MIITAFYTHNNVPVSGLSPSINIYLYDGTLENSGTMSDVGNGWYTYSAFTPLNNTEYNFTCFCGAPLDPDESLRVGSIYESNDLENAVASIPSDVWNTILVGTLTAQQLMKLSSAVLAGKSSGAPGILSPVVFRDILDTKDVVTASLDANGNRLTIVLDLS
jgi:hypothetical protein